MFPSTINTYTLQEDDPSSPYSQSNIQEHIRNPVSLNLSPGPVNYHSDFQQPGQSYYLSSGFSGTEIATQPVVVSTAENVAENDDEMIARYEEDMIWEPEHAPSKAVHYLAVDTNVFINHLNMIRAIHGLLAETRPAPMILLIPSVVVHELDGLTKSTVQPEHDSPVTLGQIARAGNKWLLEMNRERRMTGRGALRCQALVERWDPEVRHHGTCDDQILDCCLHFAHHDHGAKITLWTDDQNLSVKAEANSVPTIGGKRFTLTSFFRATGEEMPEPLWEGVRKLDGCPSDEVAINPPRRSHHGQVQPDDDMGMELDVDLYEAVPALPSRHHPIQDPVRTVSSTVEYGQPTTEETRRYPYLVSATNPELASLPSSSPSFSSAVPMHPGHFDSFPDSTITLSIPYSTHDISTYSSSTSTSRNSPSSPSTRPTASPPTTLSNRPSQKPEMISRSSTSSTSSSLSSGMASPSTGRQISPNKRPSPTSSLSSTSSDRDGASYAKLSTSTRSAITTSTSTSTSTPSPILLTSLQLSLRPSTLAFLSHCSSSTSPSSESLSHDPPSRSNLTPPSQPTETRSIVPNLIAALNFLDKVLEGNGEPHHSSYRIVLLRALGSIKTIERYVEYRSPTPHPSLSSPSLNLPGKGENPLLDYKLLNVCPSKNKKGERKIRTKEVVDALDFYLDVCAQLGIEVGEEIREVKCDFEKL